MYVYTHLVKNMLVALAIVVIIVGLYCFDPSWSPVKAYADSAWASVKGESYRQREFGQLGISFEPYRQREFQQMGITSSTMDTAYRAGMRKLGY